MHFEFIVSGLLPQNLFRVYIIIVYFVFHKNLMITGKFEADMSKQFCSH